MNGLASAHELLDRVERAVDEGDLVTAAETVRGLRPLLSGVQIEEIKALKRRVDSLNLNVHHHRRTKKTEIKKLNENTSAIAQYHQVAGNRA